MIDVFQYTAPVADDLFFRKNDANDRRLGELVGESVYERAEIVILGCPQDEGVRRNGGRPGAAGAPAAIRRQFYKLTNFGIDAAKIFDLGDTLIQTDLEATHLVHRQTVECVLRDGKRLIVLGGGNDVSYPDGAAMATVFGADDWTALNIDQHFDARADAPRNSGTPYRQLLDERLLKPENFYEIGFQAAAASPVYHDFLQQVGVNLISLEEFQAADGTSELQARLSTSPLPTFFGFDLDVVRAADAPGTSAPSPNGLTAEQFCRLAQTAGDSPNTKIVEFSEVNPEFDQDDRTAKLVALAMHDLIRRSQKLKQK